MALNIKNEEVYRLARKLADQLGVSMTEAVRVALERTVEEERTELMKRIEEIVAVTAPLLKDIPDHGELLYDESGLPR